MLYCQYCTRPVDTDSSSKVEGVAWCPHCHEVFRVPWFKIPGWVAGTLCFLIIRLDLIV